MRRKVIIGVLLGIFVISAGMTKTNARTLNGNVNFKDGYYVNLFYEFSNSTKLASMLGEQGENIGPYICSIYNDNKASDNTYRCNYGSTSYISIMHNFEVLNDIDLFYNSADVKKIYHDIKYVFRVGSSTDRSLHIKNDYVYMKGLSDALAKDYYVFYDENMQLLGTSYIQPGGSKEFKAEISSDDIVSIFSHFYASGFDVSVSKESDGYDKIILATIDGQFDFYDNYGMIESFLRGIGRFFTSGVVFYSSETGIFDFYKKNPIAGGGYGYTPFVNAVVGGGIEEPPGFNKIDVSNLENGVFLQPKIECGDTCDYRLYFYKTHKDSRLYSTRFTFGTEKIELVKSNVFDIYKNFELSYVDLLTKYELEDITNSLFLFNSNTAKDVVLYYDPNSWIIYYNNSTSGTTNFTYGDKTYSLTPAEKEKYYYESKKENAALNNESSSNSPTFNNFDFSPGNILEGFKTFLNSVGAIATSIGAFFDHLPPELVTLLYSGFWMGLTALIIKLFI